LIEKAYPPSLPGWIAAGGENYEVVIGSTALYVRNLAEELFPNRLTDKERVRLRTLLLENIGDIFANYRFWESEKIDKLDEQYLKERISIPWSFSSLNRGAGVFISDDESRVISLNSSDHLRFRVGTGGCDIESAYRVARGIEELLEEKLPFAYSKRFGFLTSHPRECGTGMKLRVYIHIPGLIFAGMLNKFRERVLKEGFVLKPMLDNALTAEGHLFLLETAHTLGINEEELLESCEEVIEYVVDLEIQSRKDLLEKAHFQIEDKILRGYGVLTHARMISKEEGNALASAFRLGIFENLLEGQLDKDLVTELFFVGQPAHIKKLLNPEATRIECDTKRAEVFRSYLTREE